MYTCITPHLSSSRRLQYSSLNCCLLSFSSWSLRCRRDGFTSTTNSGFTFFLYWSLWRRPFICISFAFGSLNRHSHSLQLKLITLPTETRKIYHEVRNLIKLKSMCIQIPQTNVITNSHHKPLPLKYVLYPICEDQQQ